MNRLNAQQLCYLTASAREAYDEMTASGFDPDLALALLEGFFGEAIYDLDPDNGPEESTR